MSTSATLVVQLDLILQQIHVMKLYLISEGKAYGEELAKSIAELAGKVESKAAGAPLRVNDSGDAPPPALSMPLADAVDAFPLAVRVHGQLSSLVAPATPRTLEATSSKDSGEVQLFTKRSVVVWFMLLGLASLLLYGGGQLLVELSYRGVMVTSLVTMGAAGIGASMSGLLTANKYYTERTFDPDYRLGYLVRFGVGVLAGLVAGTFGSDLVLMARQGEVEQSADTLTKAGTATPTLLALLGGYSASVVQLMMDRAVQVLTTLLTGPDASAKAEAEAKLAANAAAQLKSLSELLERATTDSAPQATIDKIKEMMDRAQRPK